MGADASHALGAPQLAGSFVNASGLAKKLTGARAGGDPGQAPRFGRVGYLSVTHDEIAIVEAKSGFRTRITDVVLARVPRTALSSVHFDPGLLLSHLTISFDSGVVWQLDIPKVNKRAAELVVRELGG